MMLCIIGSPLYQWDVNRQLEIDSDTLGNTFEIHCCLKGDPKSLVVEPIIDGDTAVVNIPNILLQRSGTLRVYVVTEGDTIYDQSFYVLARPKPDSYIYTETEVQTWSDIEKYVQKEITEVKTEVSESVNNIIGRTNDLYANALKGNKIGATISLTDVSPLEHTLDVKVQSKNLFDKNAWTSPLGEVEIDGVPCINIVEGLSMYRVPGDQSDVYTLTVKMYRNSGFEKATNLKATPPDGTVRNLAVNFYSGETRVCTVYGGEDVYFTGWSQRDICVDLSVTQLEHGTTATEYVPPIPDMSVVKVYANGSEYSVNADGTVNGDVMSKHPVTTISTDTNGAIIDCKYNRDINDAFAEMYSALISMGGNV